MSDLNTAGPDPIKDAPLKNYVKQFSDKRAGSDALEELEAELLFLTKILWKEASERADERGYQTVQKKDVKGAYDDLFEPHKLLNEASDLLEDVNDDLEKVVNKSPVYKTWESYEE